ncbi:MAG: nitrous oxide reductase family maturation protein NosD [Deltaproteobacteria bacterium]|nr:nitrous oxide reductase family maturation protein NosD [Deltaproteobacteria bacterium]
MISSLFLGLTAAANPGSITPWRSEAATGPLQATIDRLRPGAHLRLPKGVHFGPIVVRVSNVTIDGGGDAVIDARGHGSVVVVEANGVTLRGLTIRRSGESNPDVDAGISLRSANGSIVDGCRLEDVLFGIDVSHGTHVTIRNSEISSKAFEPTMRGDAIRVWSSSDVLVQGNHWHDARDAVSWYSERVTFSRNRGERSRYSVHSMYTKSLMVSNNTFEENSVGVFVMYGLGTTVIGNTVKRSSGVTGIGLGLKETSGVYADGNTFVYCAVGVLVDNSPWEPNTRNWFRNNQIAFNGVGIMLANDRAGNEFFRNAFRGNRIDVDTEQRRQSPGQWVENTWDAYEGLDRDADGFGDVPYVPKKYGDLLTGEHPAAQFFVGAPVLTLINIIERLVPITEPIVLLDDPRPRMSRASSGLTTGGLAQ